MRQGREQFDRWLDEWKEHTWSHQPREWPRLQVTEADVQQQTRRILSGPSRHGLDRLSLVVDAVAMQRRNHTRCRARTADEILVLRRARGRWAEIADWTTMDEGTVRAMTRTPSPRVGPNAARADEELAVLLRQVPVNPFFRICELLAAARFYDAVANELEDATDWLCFELASAGTDRSQIARHANIGQLTLARRIKRARSKRS